MLSVWDPEIVEGLQHHLRDLGVICRFGEAVVAVDRLEGTITHFRERQAGCGSGSVNDR
jgi:hypothetical protein